MTRVKSFGQGVTEIANPYECPKPRKKSTYHREHRSKKNRKHTPEYHNVMIFKHKKQELIEQTLDL
jgi:hypothetical protein